MESEIAFRNVRRAYVVGLTVLGLFLAPAVIRAQDTGPRPDVRAIRHDLPIILSAQRAMGQLSVEDVVVSGSDALVQARAGDWALIILLQKHLRTWWFENQVEVQATGAVNSCWPSEIVNDLTPQFLKVFGAPQELIDSAMENLPLVSDRARGAAAAALRTPSPNAKVIPRMDVYCVPLTDQIGFQQSGQKATTTGNYTVQMHLGSNDGLPSALLKDVAGRPPTEGESWLTPNSNSYFFFYATVSSNTVIHVAGGTTLDIWFPFALNPAKTYNLMIAHVDPMILKLDGTLKDNILHFVLPAFAVAPGARLMAEIDGEPYDR